MVNQPGNLPVMQLTISDAAEHLHVSHQTIRRRLYTGVLKGEKLPTPQGYTWMVEIPETSSPRDDPASNQDDLLALLRNQLEQKDQQIDQKDQQIDQLHRLLAQAALPAAPAPHWWQFWR